MVIDFRIVLSTTPRKDLTDRLLQSTLRGRGRQAELRCNCRDGRLEVWCGPRTRREGRTLDSGQLGQLGRATPARGRPWHLGSMCS